MDSVHLTLSMFENKSPKEIIEMLQENKLLDEFMWREVYAQGTIQETFQNFITHLKRKFLVA